MRPVALDLFCGLGGWTNALLDAGFTVYGFDINPQPEYRGLFVQADLLQVTAADLRHYGASFAACSSPCEQFSIHGMKHFHPNPPYPAMGIRLFEHSRAILEELGIPYVMENVRPAESFVGKAVNHCGPFYLWGNGVPAIFPRDAYKVSKGIDWGSSKDINACESQEQKRAYRDKPHFYNRAFSTSAKRKQDVAKAAQIPPEIAATVAEFARIMAEQAA